MPHAQRTIVIARPPAEVTPRIAGPGGRQVPADVEITALDPDTWLSAAWPARSALKVITPSLRPRAARP